MHTDGIDQSGSPAERVPVTRRRRRRSRMACAVLCLSVVTAALGGAGKTHETAIAAPVQGDATAAGNAAVASAAVTHQRRVVGYFPTWLRNSGYSASDIDFSVVTHVAHFAVVPRVDGSIEVPDWGPFPDPDLLARAHAAGAKVVLVVGGDHAAANAGFAAMTALPIARQKAIGNLVRLVVANGYDGIDLDWEFPSSEADRAHLTAFVQELHEALDAGRSLSLAAPATDWWGQWFDIPALLPNLDWIGAMTYALSGPSWSAHADNSSALYSGWSDEPSVDLTAAYYASRGVPTEKLLIGLPFYGEQFDDVSALHQPLDGRSGGALDYPSIMPLVGADWILHRDAQGQVPYLTRAGGSGLISYDDPASIAAKCAYVVANHLGGAIVWHLGQDRMDGSQPLLRAAAGCA